jgi:hypothetical protein
MARFYRATLSSYRAGLKLTSPLLPIMAVVLTLAGLVSSRLAPFSITSPASKLTLKSIAVVAFGVGRRYDCSYSGEGTAGSFSPRIRRLLAGSLPPMARTCSVALASPKTGTLE